MDGRARRLPTTMTAQSVLANDRGPAWDLHWEAHNLLAPEPLATIELAATARNSSSTMRVLLGHFDTLFQCQEHLRGRHDTHSFTYILPSHRQRALRGACFAVTSARWEPTITGEAVSGRQLCARTQEYVSFGTGACPDPLSDELPRRSDYVICMLAAGIVHDNRAASTIRSDLSNLFAHYGQARTADILAFHDGGLSPTDRNKLRAEFATFSAVLLDRSNWRPPLALDLDRFYKRSYTDSLGPRDTARWLGFRFWTRVVFRELQQRGYGWVLRLGRGARMRSQVPIDLFETIRARGAAYGYRLAGCEPVQRADFFRLVQRSLLQQQVKPIWLLDDCVARGSLLEFDRSNCARGGMLQGALQVDFFLANVSFFAQPAVERFLEGAVDRSAAIWRFNWHEGFWHTVAVRSFARREHALHLSGWTHEIASASTHSDRPAADEPLSVASYVDPPSHEKGLAVPAVDPAPRGKRRKWRRAGVLETWAAHLEACAAERTRRRTVSAG